MTFFNYISPSDNQEIENLYLCEDYSIKIGFPFRNNEMDQIFYCTSLTALLRYNVYTI